MSNWKLPGLSREIELYVDPPEIDFGLFDVGDQSPTEDDVRAASDALVAAEVELQALPDLIRDLQDDMQVLSQEYERTTATEDQRLIYADAITRLRHLLDAWMSYYQTLGDYVSRLRAQIAVMEHDIEWQRYVSEQFGTTEFERRSKDHDTGLPGIAPLVLA